MYIQSILILTLCFIKVVQMSTVCRMTYFESCPHHDLITTSTYQGFIPPDELNNKCRNMKMALDCGESSSYLIGCEEKELLEYKMVKQLHRSICTELQANYRNSSICFQSQNLQDSVDMCLMELSIYFEDPEFCFYFEQYLKCIRDLQDSNCDQNNISLLNKILLSYIHPVGVLNNCSALDDEKMSTFPASPSTATSHTSTTSTAIVRGKFESLGPSATPTEPTEVQTTHESVGRPAVRVDQLHDMMKTDRIISQILSALMPKSDSQSLNVCNDGPIVQVNNLIFINGLNLGATTLNKD